MKLALLAAAALVSAPLGAQTMPATPTQDNPTPPSGQSATMAPPTPTATPDGAVQAAPAMPNQTMANGSMPDGAMNTPTAPSSGTPMSTADATPMAGGKLPWCRPGQYDDCRERETKGGKGLRKN